jgi:predicted helicase
LAYYIAAVNIENAYHDLLPDATSYQSFEGICLTDTFQLGESKDGEKLFSEMFPQNSKRVQRQQKAPLRIIFGNPPYSVGQKSKNDIAQNQDYPHLEKRISDTYIKASKTSETNSNSLKKFYYDAYIKAFRWSTDRLGNEGGIVSFISNGGWINSNSLNGFRISLQKEFSSIYVFDLRGNAIGSGENRKKEAGNVFQSGTRTPIAITLLVKKKVVNSDAKNLVEDLAKIYYYDIGDYLSREEKLSVITNFKNISTINFNNIVPNESGDWIKQRSEGFENLIELAPEKKKDTKTKSFFILNTNGVVSGRSNWVNNFSLISLKNNVNRMITFLNSQSDGYKEAIQSDLKTNVNDFIDTDETKIKWDDKLIRKVSQGKHLKFDDTCLRYTYRTPFCKENIYFNEDLNWSRVLLPKVFPTLKSKNLLISCVGKGASREFSVLISDSVVDYHFEQNGQCFPLFYYEENNATQRGMFDEDNKNDFIRRDAISDFILERAKKIYGKNVIKEDVFYYVYGFLHSKEYRAMFVNDLKKMLPRLPLVEVVKDFWAFSKAGRKLAELHLNYETVAPFADAKVTGDDGKFYTVEKLRFPKKDQKDTIIYNSKISISNIPAQAYEYVVNGKSAIEWIIDRYQVSTHKESGITNNPNDWATETGNPRYILDLLLSVINVSVQTVEIVNALPNIDFSAEQNEDYVVKMYSNSDENENLNIAAEPDNEYL